MELEINEFKKNNIINEKITYFLIENYNLNKLLKIIEFIIIFTFFNIIETQLKKDFHIFLYVFMLIIWKIILEK